MGQSGQTAPEPQPTTPAPATTAPAPTPAIALPVPLDDRVRVGLLLPLSGKNEALGQALLQAAEMALFEAGQRAETITLVVRDSEQIGGPGVAAQQLAQEQVKLVLGPLFGAQVAQTLPPLKAANIPLISFSSDRSVAGPGSYILGIMPQTQIERVLTYAMGRGYRSFAAMVPDSAYGRSVVGALQATTQASRGAASMAMVDFYPTDGYDLSANVQRLAAARGSFDALLLPEGGDRLRIILSLLPAFDVDQNQAKFLGTALWNDAALLQDPMLVGAWFAAPPAEGWLGFERRYREAYGTTPPRVASVVYDAVALAIALGSQKPGGDFSAAALTQPDGFAGLDGLFRLRSDGVNERGLAVMEALTGRVVVVDPAPASFAPPGS